MREPDFSQTRHFNFLTLLALEHHGGQANASEIDSQIVASVKAGGGDVLKMLEEYEPDELRADLSQARDDLRGADVIGQNQPDVWALTEKGAEYLKIPRTESEELLNDEVLFFIHEGWVDESLREGEYICGFSAGMLQRQIMEFELKRRAAANPGLSADEIREAAIAAYARRAETYQTSPGIAFIPAETNQFYHDMNEAETAEELSGLHYPSIDRGPRPPGGEEVGGSMVIGYFDEDFEDEDDV